MQLTLEDLRKDFKKAGYICDEETVLTVYLSLTLEKPILIEGPPAWEKLKWARCWPRYLTPN